MKRSIAIIIAIACLFSLVTGCKKTEKTDSGEGVKRQVSDNFNPEGFPIVNETVKLKVIGIDDGDTSPEESILYQELENLTNVDIEWTVISRNAWEEKKGILFANNDLPDIIIGNQCLSDQDILNYSKQGLIIPINDLYDKYGHYMKEAYAEHPEVKKMVTAADGNMYSFPEFDRGFPITTRYPLYINKDWLDAVGMNVPTTTEEFYQVLKAFKEKDPNGNGKSDEIPYTFSKKMFDLFGAFGIPEDDSNNHITVKNNKVIYTLASPEYKEGMKYFYKLFKEGLIDEEAFTQDGGMMGGKVKSDTRIVGAFQTWRSTGWKRSPEDRDDEYVAVSPLAGPDGTRMWTILQPGGARGAGVITNNCKYPEVAFRWLDSLYEPKWSVQMSLLYYIGEHMVEEGDKYKIIRKPERDVKEDSKYFAGPRIFNVRNSTGSKFTEKPAHIIEKQNLDKLYEDYYSTEFYPVNAFMTQEENEKLTEISIDINNYAEEMFAMWMTNGGIEEEWDAYLKKLNDMGLKRYLEIFQGVYDRYTQ